MKEGMGIETGDEIHIGRDDALVVAGVVVLASLGRETSAVAAVVDEEEVAGLGRSDEIMHGAADVLAGGLNAIGIGVDEDGDVVLGEAIAVDEAVVHSFDIVDAALELSLGSLVIASNQQRLLPHDSRQLSFSFSRSKHKSLLSLILFGPSLPKFQGRCDDWMNIPQLSFKRVKVKPDVGHWRWRFSGVEKKKKKATFIKFSLLLKLNTLS